MSSLIIVQMIMALAILRTQAISNLILGSWNEHSAWGKLFGQRLACEAGQDMYVPVGSTWEERCRKCRCDLYFGALCSGPVCPITYEPSQEQSCRKWSDDECCCEKVGCLKYGQIHKFGELYFDRPNNPCSTCLCRKGAAAPECYYELCFDQGLPCVDAIREAGKCCKSCPHGHNCRIPPLLGVKPEKIQMTLYLMTEMSIQSDENPRMFFNCKCLNGGRDAACTNVTFSFRSSTSDRRGDMAPQIG